VATVTEAGRPTSGTIVSHAFRAANGMSVFMAVPWTRDAQESLDDLRRAIGETHKFVKIGREACRFALGVRG
jgi:hypothetical protein